MKKGKRSPVRNLVVYALLIGGSAVFAWPFLWMASTSVKIDKELYGETMQLLPQRPIPALRSPYVDARQFGGVDGPRIGELLPEITQRLRALDFPWPAEIDREQAIDQTARGIYRKLEQTLPKEVWEKPLPELVRIAGEQITPALAAETLAQARRAFGIGQLRARSHDMVEDELVRGQNVAAAWNIGGDAKAELVQVPDADPHAELRYDFSQGNRVELSQTFRTTFPIDRLYRLQLSFGPDDSWHAWTVYVEKLGVRYKAERPVALADTRWRLMLWQERGPDDLSNKIKSWLVLREVDRGSQYESDPRKIKVTLELRKTRALGAWWAKIKRNYQITLDYIPFWRYVATSVFLVILNILGTLFSCSLVAYSFARLRWPGRGFCFALMLATMMVPSQVTMIPHFLIMRSLGWYNTLYPLWIGNLFASAFNVFLLRQFLKGVPRDLEDAAKIDGCGFWRVYWHIMLPLVKPTLAAIAIFTFMATWNDFMGPLIYLNDQRLYPLSLGLYALNVQAGGGNFGMMMAGSLLMTLPVIVIFFFCQRYFLQGVTLTGMKG